MKANKTNSWKITARVIGEKLLAEPFLINDCIIEILDVDKQRSLTLLPSRPEISAQGGEECYMSFLASDNKKIVSHYFISATVLASTPFEAENLAEKKFEETLNIISLALGCKDWYEFSLCGINRIVNGDLVNVESVSSFGVRIPINLSPKPFSDDNRRKIENLVEVTDTVFKKSLHYLALGEKRLNTDLTRQSDRLDIEAFLNFFKVIELISNKLIKNEDIKIEKNTLETLLSKFKEEYGELSDVKKQISCIEKYQNAISILKGKYLSEKIKKAGEILSISGASVNSALEFNKIRNSYDVVHARNLNLNEKKIDYLKLSNTAREFLNCYLISIH